MGGCCDCASHKKTISKNLADFRGFLWNERTREFMGRTAKDWVEIFFFYLVFYSLLAAFWASLLFIRVKLLPEDTDGPLRTDYLTHRGPGLNDLYYIIVFSHHQHFSRIVPVKKIYHRGPYKMI